MCNNQAENRWLQNANNFLENTQLEDGNSVILTLRYIMQNAVGIEQRIPISNILEHLQHNGIEMGREEFQQTILNTLKSAGIVATLIYPGSNGGVFIPSNEEEVSTVVNQILRRVSAELGHILPLINNNGFLSLRQDLERIINELNGLNPD